MTGQQTQTPKQRGAWWQSSIMAIVALIVFVAVVVGLDAALKPDLTGTALILVGVLLAIIPAVLWLVFFYLQDRLEPEPKKEVAKIFIVGLALAGAIGIPLTYQVFHVQEWLYRGPVPLVLGSFFIVGAIEAFIVYAAVRFFIYDSPEFDERTDGIVYATAAGLGYATALNEQRRCRPGSSQDRGGRGGPGPRCLCRGVGLLPGASQDGAGDNLVVANGADPGNGA